MPPANETTSGRLATANSARISEAVIPAVRAAKRSVGTTERAAAAAAPATAPASGAEVPDDGGGVAGCGTVVLPVLLERRAVSRAERADRV
ncbi:hypothetical protein GCM10009609_11750 [Pseudonocardia aurantiaca]